MLGLQAWGATTVTVPFSVACWPPAGPFHAAVPVCPDKIIGKAAGDAPFPLEPAIVIFADPSKATPLIVRAV